MMDPNSNPAIIEKSSTRPPRAITCRTNQSTTHLLDLISVIERKTEIKTGHIVCSARKSIGITGYSRRRTPVGLGLGES